MCSTAPGRPTRSNGSRSTEKPAQTIPWLSPFESEAVKALLVTIGAAQTHGLEPETTRDELDIRGLAEDAGCTDKQIEVFMFTCAGRRQCDIARVLGISHAGVQHHLETARRKLVRIVPPPEVLREIASA